MTRVMERTVVLANRDLPSTSHDRCKLMSLLLRSSSEFESDSSDMESQAGRSRHKSESKQCRRDQSRRRISAEVTDGKRHKNKRESSQSSDEKDRGKSDKSPTDASISSEENRNSHNNHNIKTREGEEKLRVMLTINCCFKITVNYRMYRLADTSFKDDRRVSKNVTKMVKRMTAQIKPHTFDMTELDSRKF